MEDFSKNQLKPNAAPKLFHSNSLKPRQSADDEETKVARTGFLDVDASRSNETIQES